MSKKEMVIVGISILIIVSTLFIVSRIHKMETSPPGPWITLEQTVSEEGWTLTVSSVNKPLGIQDISCYLWNVNTENPDFENAIEKTSLKAIKDNASGYGISFTASNSSILSKGDRIFISRAGGAVGSVEKGFKLRLMQMGGGFWLCDVVTLK